ncbi:Uncharacterised protein [Pseudomonas putida]|nr:hypothetical protein [Pseudomonas asiatica]CAB5622199.1 Uncharacterised protein [Pseudomonas putida]CAB5648105.1 Uncharacterised protein [Pseudomonas putida]CAB5692644.1 Uncharacterised protein [Pseudomonas putida]CAC9676073.1 Uncharacterised protein [Pseudomonas putida]CAC9685114.1 Uncharacterised protein [Pseudomonas putida]
MRDRENVVAVLVAEARISVVHTGLMTEVLANHNPSVARVGEHSLTLMRHRIGAFIPFTHS